MSLELSGLDSKALSGSISINIPANHPLLLLANIINWKYLLDLVLRDLKNSTKKGNLNLGRKLLIRVHLAIYLLQKMYDLSDRNMERFAKDNAAFQMFCGAGQVKGFRIPDHTKIEEFRNRLTPETQKIITNYTAQVAVEKGYADPSTVDIDSTTQEANIGYPSDAQLMSKMASTASKVLKFLSEKLNMKKLKKVSIDLKGLKAKAKTYFFLAKNKQNHVRKKVFRSYYRKFRSEMLPVLEHLRGLRKKVVTDLPWNIRRGWDQLTSLGPKYIQDVGYFVRKNCIKVGKSLAFHVKEFSCISKGKPGKPHTFGRVFQIGRLAGNFLFVASSTSIRMPDKHSITPIIEEHSKVFGQDSIKSIATDKGYWSMENFDKLEKSGVEEIGLQRPKNLKIKSNLSQETQEKLYNRRSGIEPLIGHAKHGGQLGRSRMKTDQGTLAAGYGSITGLNLRQLANRMIGKMAKGSSIGSKAGVEGKFKLTVTS
jgi:transposase, IS5 family